MDVSIYKQVGERALMTFAQTFLAMFVVTDMQSAKGALTAAVAAGLSVLKSFAATKVGDKSTASLV
jgi:hypothetical protein